MAKITKIIYLFGERIEVEVEEEENDNDQEPVVRTRGGLELPFGAFFVAKKTLKESDISKAQGRLLIPNCPEMHEFLTERERSLVSGEGQGITITVMDNRNRLHELSFTLWQSVDKIVLNRGWNKVVTENQLQPVDVVELWCYRRDNRLCFAVDICERGGHQGTNIKVLNLQGSRDSDPFISKSTNITIRAKI